MAATQAVPGERGVNVKTYYSSSHIGWSTVMARESRLATVPFAVAAFKVQPQLQLAAHLSHIPLFVEKARLKQSVWV